MQLIKQENKKELKKHVATIHCANTLSLLQRKVSNALLYFAYPNLLKEEEHEITIGQLCRIINYQGHNYAAIKNALRGLLSTIIEWNVINEQGGEDDWTASTIIASVRIKNGICYYAYSPRMKALLYSPSVYGKINLIVQSRFRSSYGLALYENCVRYLGLTHTRWFEFNIFRKLMGVPDDKYPIFRDFKRRVLDKSLEEINSYSDIIVTPEIKRRGRQVSEIRFLLKERTKKLRLGSDISENKNSDQAEFLKLETLSLLNKLTSVFAFPTTQAENLLKQYGYENVLEKINIIESSPSYQKGEIVNLTAYLLSAIKKDFKPAPAQQDLKLKKQHDELQRIEALEKKREHEKQQKEYDDHIAKLIDEAYATVNSAIKNKMENKFIESLKQENDHFLLTKFRVLGFEDKVIKIFFRKFLTEHYADYLPSLPTFKEFAPNDT